MNRVSRKAGKTASAAWHHGASLARHPGCFVPMPSTLVPGAGNEKSSAGAAIVSGSCTSISTCTLFRHGSMNLTVPQAPERSGPVILSEAKDLAVGRERPFASLRVTRYHCSNGQGHFIQIEPCLNKLNRPPVGADLSRPPPIYRPKGGSKILRLFCKTA